jgi:hypothetical protein
MTDQTSRKPARLTKGSARAWGWVAGTIAFVLPWAAIGAKVKASAGSAEASAEQPRPVVIIRKVTRRVIVQHAAPTQAPQVRYVTVGGGSSGGSSGGGGSAPAAPPPPPPASTGGS